MQRARFKMELLLPVHFHATTVSVKGKMMMLGVDEIEQKTRTDRVFTAWLTVPSLPSMAGRLSANTKPAQHLHHATPSCWRRRFSRTVWRYCAEMPS